MHTPSALLKSFASASAATLARRGGGEFAPHELSELAQAVWASWGQGRTPEQRRADLEAVARADGAPLNEEVAALVAQAPAQPPGLRAALTAHLLQVPPLVRKALRRPLDPSGKTAAPGYAPADPDDVLLLLPPRLTRFQPGQRPFADVDRQLEELLGIGGFGEVWKAVNPNFPSAAPVALKFCVRPDAAAVLRNEALVLDRVMRHGRHPGIVQLQHTYLSAQVPCLEYEYVAGGDLAGLILEWHRAGKAAPAPALRSEVVLRLADTVAFAHQHGIVHRDLKPANVLVVAAPNGIHLKIADFGIGGVAAQQAIEQTRGGTLASAFLSTALRGACTPLYASPQQLRGEPADPRDDVYSLGVIWYQLLTGNLSTGRPGGSRWRQVLAEQGFASPVIELLERCFEDARADRPADGLALVEELQRALAKPVSVSPASPHRTWWYSLVPGNVLGPIPEPQLLAMLRSGQVELRTKVHRVGAPAGDWQELGTALKAFIGQSGASVGESEEAHLPQKGASGRLPCPEPCLVVIRGQKLGVKYPIFEGENYVGRADEKPVDIDLEDQETPDRVWTSRQHACISFENNQMFIEDLNSATGTYVNRTRVYPGSRRPLAIEDVVQIGTVQMKVVLA
jgi:serine/threonine protein kinase